MQKYSSLNMESMSMLRYLFFIMRYPLEGYEELRWNKKGSLKLSVIILAAWFVTEIVRFRGTGFVVNTHNLEKLNIFIIFFNTVIVFAVCIISNWCFCTLMDGEGRLPDIWITCSYALVPYILFTLPVTLITNFIAKPEFIFLQFAEAIGIGWSCLLMITAVKVTHQYNLKKTIGSIILTAFGVCVVLFITILFLSMLQNLLMFIQTIYSEITFRK